MKRLFILLLCVCSVTFATQDYSKKAIAVTKDNPVATITFDSNPTTGYRYYIKDYPEELIDSIHQEYIAPNDNTPGKGGQSVWTVKFDDDAFNAPHVLSLTFVHARSWEIDDAEESTVYFVTVI